MKNAAVSPGVSFSGTRRNRRGAGSDEQAGWGTAVMLLFVRNSLTTSEVCAGALSWCNNQSPFFDISGNLHLTFSLSYENLAVKLPIDSLTRWNKLLVRNSSNLKNKWSELT